MSSAIPSRPKSSSRNWWSRSTKNGSADGSKPDMRAESSPRDSSRKSPSFKFNTFVSAIGFKSKKHPSLTIEDPPDVKPVAITSLKGSSTVPRIPRPKAISIASTIRSWKDVPEPQPLSDLPRVHSQTDTVTTRRRSLLTISDSNPFVSPRSPGRHSTPAIILKNNDTPSSGERTSSTSTSPHLQSKDGNALSRTSVVLSLGSSAEANEPTSSAALTDSDAEFLENSAASSPESHLSGLREDLVKMDHDGEGSETSSELPNPRSASSTTLTEANLFTGPIPIRHSESSRERESGETPRMTCIVHPANQSEPFPPSNLTHPVSRQPSTVSHQSTTDRPLLVVRHASIKQISPPLAPPTQELPPPPESGSLSECQPMSLQFRDRSLSSGRSSNVPSVVHRSSSLSSKPTEKSQLLEPDFSPLPPSSNNCDRHAVDSSLNAVSDTGSHPLRKKILSQHSLPRRPSTASKAMSTSPPLDRDISLRKQRSFHHTSLSKSPPPTLLRHANSFTPMRPSSPAGSPSPSEQRTGSIIYPRKRLFSGSSLRSSTRGRPHSPEEDLSSIFSVSTEPERGRKLPLVNTLPSHDTVSIRSSFWEENPLTPGQMTPSSPTVSTPTDYVPQQIMSTADMLKVEACVLAGADPESVSRQGGLALPTPVSDTALSSPFPESLSASNFTHNAEQEGNPRRSWQPSRSASMTDTTSRRRIHPSTSQSSMGNSTSPSRASLVLPTTGLPPPPRPRPRKPITHFDDPADAHIVPLSPPPIRKSLRPKGSGETMRRSILKKPSFLEIEDEVEKPDVPPVSSSFLDFRESFDTVRNTTDATPS